MIYEIDNKTLAKLIALWFALSIALISFLSQLALLGQPVVWGTVESKASINGVAHVLVVSVDGVDYALRADLITWLRNKCGAKIPLVATDNGFEVLRRVI